MYVWFRNVYVVFVSFDIPPGSDTTLNNWGKMRKLRENVIICFSTINHPITSKLKSLNYSFIFMLTITAKFFSIKTDKVTWTTKKMRNFSKMAKAV